MRSQSNILTVGTVATVAGALFALSRYYNKASHRDGEEEDFYTSVDEIPGLVRKVRRTASSGLLVPLEFRKEQLLKLIALVKENRSALCDAVKKDLSRHPAFTNKVLDGCLGAFSVAINKLEAWSAPERVSENKEVRYVPRGMVLVIGTWNFPNPLALKPLAAAIAAGNTVILKMSEVAPTIGKLLGNLIEKYCDSRVVRVVQGGVPQATALLKENFDLIFYTGNTGVGKIVMKAAARHLTPCVLELGGKNPVVVARDANLYNAARKIIDGRLKNAGQFCVAPDYVICEESVKKELVNEMCKAVEEFFTKDPKTCDSYSRIVNKRHTKRLVKMLTENHGGKIVKGGMWDVSDCYIAPTIVVDPSKNSSLLTEEIFGPILPVISVSSIANAMELICSKPRSLALYVFTSTQSIADRVVNGTKSGGACVNDVIVHMLNEQLPFGGNGESGHGSYHGIYGFRTFSHQKSVMSISAEDLPLNRFPPFSEVTS
eukprot:g1104.t1